MKTFRRITKIVVMLIVLVVVGLAAGIYYIPNKLTNTAEVQTLIIEENETGAEIGDVLYERGLIRSTWAFRVALRVNNVMDKLQAGYYQIPDNISMHDLIGLLQQGKLKTIRITVPEGYTMGEIAILLEKHAIMDSQTFINEAREYAPYMYMYGPKKTSYRVEGFLFPSTYEIPVNSTAKEVIDLMAREMNRQLTPEIRAELEKQHMTIFEFVTLASLVEKEAKFDEDRELIAAVFKKRLAIGMPIQSDASIQYILGYPKVHVTIEDTRLQSPYNTYIYAGYPPGPIANPGKKSLDAVLHAPDTDYLYFVADKDGHNHFTKTYEEHLKVVESLYGN